MKATALLLVLLWSLVEVHSQTAPYVSLSSSPLSPIVAGDSLTLTCSVTLPAGVTGTPDIQWEGPGVTLIPAAPTTSGQEVSSVLTLSAIATSQAGQYSCTATLSGSSISTALTVTVQSKFTVINCLLRVKCHYSPLVPVPTPSITASPSIGALYAGTLLSLTCDYTLSSSVDTAPQTSMVWMVGGAAVDTSPGRISATGDTLSFSPLATSDSGSYTCQLTVTTQQTHVTVQAPEQSAVEDITVQRNALLRYMIIHSLFSMCCVYFCSTFS